MAPRTLPATALAAMLLAVGLATGTPAVPAEAELGVEARAIVDAAQALTADLNSSSSRAEVQAAHDALLALAASVDARVRVGDVTLLEGDVVEAAVQQELDETFWLLLLLDVRADPLAAYDAAVEKVHSAEDKLDVDVTRRGAAHARHQLEHALGLATALDIVGGACRTSESGSAPGHGPGCVDADVLAELTARIHADLDRARGAEAAAEACGCPITLEVKTAVNVVASVAADVAGKAAASVGAAASAMADLVGV